MDEGTPQQCRCGFTTSLFANHNLEQEDEVLFENYHSSEGRKVKLSSCRESRLRRICQRLLHPGWPMANIPKKSKPKLGMFFGVNLFVGFLAALSCILVYKDNQNALLGLEEWQTLKFRKEYFEVGAYPMGGMFTSLAGAVLDAMTIFIFLFGFTCSCIYYRHYVRLALISLLVTITADVVLFCTQQRAADYLGRYFKIVIEFEYKNVDAPTDKTGQNFVDAIQTSMECCGYKGPEDWKKSAWLPDILRELMLPKTCCKNVNVKSCSIMDDFYKIGCADSLFTFAGRWRTVAKYCLLLKIVSIIVSILLGTQLYKEHVLEMERKRLFASRRKYAARKLAESKLDDDVNFLTTIHETNESTDTQQNSKRTTIRDKLPQYRFHKVSNINNSNVEIVSGTI